MEMDHSPLWNLSLSHLMGEEPELREAERLAQGHTAWTELGTFSTTASQLCHLHPCWAPPVTPTRSSPSLLPDTQWVQGTCVVWWKVGR